MSKSHPIPVVPDVDSIVAERYHLLDVISYDPQCTVFRARDTRCARFVDVAVHDDKHRDQHEARLSVLEKLHHPGLCDLVDHGWDLKGPYLVYERPGGRSLRRWMMERGRMSVGQLASCLTQLLLAVSHVHAAGLVHRSVSPDTVFVDGDIGRTSTVKLAAVHGCCQAGELAPPGTLSSQDSLAIRVSQFSPARLEPYDDVFSLGILLRTALDLEAGTDRFSYGAHHSLGLLIEACLSPSLEVRPVDAGEVLERFLDYLPAPRRSPASAMLPPELAPLSQALMDGEVTQLLLRGSVGAPVSRPPARGMVQSLAAVVVGAATLGLLIFAPASCASQSQPSPVGEQPTSDVVASSHGEIVTPTPPVRGPDERPEPAPLQSLPVANVVASADVVEPPVEVLEELSEPADSVDETPSVPSEEAVVPRTSRRQKRRRRRRRARRRNARAHRAADANVGTPALMQSRADSAATSSIFMGVDR